MEELTPKEQEVLQCLVKGSSNYEIAQELAISFHTVKAHLSSIYRKLEVDNRVQATCKAILCADKDLK